MLQYKKEYISYARRFLSAFLGRFLTSLILIVTTISLLYRGNYIWALVIGILCVLLLWYYYYLSVNESKFFISSVIIFENEKTFTIEVFTKDQSIMYERISMSNCKIEAYRNGLSESSSIQTIRLILENVIIADQHAGSGGWQSGELTKFYDYFLQYGAIRNR